MLKGWVRWIPHGYQKQTARMNHKMAYEKSAQIYDKIYNFKDYAKDVALLQAIIAQYGTRPYHTLLDVGCGTGAHLTHLHTHYECAGVDYAPAMVEVARQKFPEMLLAEGDMRTFQLGKTFDLVICLFSAIGYMQTVEDLHLAMANMAKHVVAGGLLVVEGWFSAEAFKPGHVGFLSIDEPDFKMARTNNSRVEGRLSIMDMHHLIGRPDGIDYFVEQHVMGLFSREEYLSAVQAAGLDAFVDDAGFSGRGIYIGRQPVARP
jgi:trans-aconitate methyltransferase